MLIQQIKCATTDCERQAAQAALDAHTESFGDAKTRKFIYRVEVLGKAYQIEVVSAKKFMVAEVRNCHRRLNKVAGNA